MSKLSIKQINIDLGRITLFLYLKLTWPLTLNSECHVIRSKASGKRGNIILDIRIIQIALVVVTEI